MSYNFGSQIERLLKEQQKTKKSLYEFLEMSPQGFIQMLKNDTVSAAKLAQIADFFDVPVSVFYGDNKSEQPVKKSADKGAFGDSVLTAILEEMRALKAQLSTKDKQIDGLQRTVDNLSGLLAANRSAKSFKLPVPFTGKVRLLHNEEPKAELKLA